jgi:hypothetical protein
MAKEAEQLYETVIRDATEDIFLVATRQAIDTRLIVVEFDAGREPGLHAEHTLNISVRESDLSVSASGIAHEWLPVSTGFIDTRFSRLVAGLLSDLVKKAQQAGRFI